MQRPPLHRVYAKDHPDAQLLPPVVHVGAVQPIVDPRVVKPLEVSVAQGDVGDFWRERAV